MNDNTIKKKNKKMSSIARKLHFQLISKKMGLFFASNIVLVLALSIGWIVMEEYRGLGEFVLGNKRKFIVTEETFDSIRYLVYEDGKEVLRLNPVNAIYFIIDVLIVVIIFQIINLIFSYYADHKRIKKILSPLDELAEKAAIMSDISFEGENYHMIEDAITKISPEKEQHISLGNEDLQGIENAINNMLHRMQESNRQQSRFVDDASHELRTPIAVIQGYANMLDRWGKDDPEILDESITAIKNESDHMSHLVEQLLFLARGDNGRNVLHFENVPLGSLVNEIYEESLMIDEAHVYKYVPYETEIYINADLAMLKQAVRILVDNAAKYTKEGDEIRLRAGKDETGSPFIEVQDTGIGMSSMDVNHMFDRFYRSDETRDIQGTGLGLSIAKWIVEKHKGHFEVLSRTELGTRIRIILDKSVSDTVS